MKEHPKIKACVTFNEYESFLLESLAEKYPHNLAIPRERAWIIRQATRSVAEAILADGRFSMPVTVTLRASSRAESEARIKKLHELKGELSHDSSEEDESVSESGSAESSTQTNVIRPPFWNGFKRGIE